MTFLRYGKTTNADVTSIEEVVSIETQGFSRLYIDLTVATAALTDFQVDYKVLDGSVFTVATSSGDFTTPTFPVLKASGNLNAAATGHSWLILDVLGVTSVSLKAASGTSASVTARWNLG